MSTPVYVTIVPEGQLEQDALRQLIAYSCPKIAIFDSLLERKIPNRETKASGRDSLQKNIHRYRNAAAKAGQAYVILFDLEHDYPCAPALLTKWELAGVMPDNFIVNIAVRSTEAWLMADREGIAHFLSVSSDNIPLKPDEIEYPKQKLMSLGQMSRLSKTRRAFASVTGKSAGSGYNSYMRDYIQNRWRIDIAADASRSLSRALERLRQLDSQPQNEPNA